MSQTIKISPGTNIISKIVEHLVPDGKDYGRNMVIFPGKRPTHFIRKALGETLKSGFIPPALFSIDEFINHLYESSFNQKDRLLDGIDAVSFLYKINTQHPISANHFKSLDDFLPLSLKIFSELEEFYIYGISEEEISRKLSQHPIEKVRLLSVYYKEFYSLLKENNYSTRSMRYRMVAESINQIDFNEYHTIILAGFYALTNVEKKIFQHLKQKDNVLFILQEGFGIEKRLEEIGIVVEENESIQSTPHFHFYKSADTHGQVFALTNLIQEKIKNTEKLDEQTVFVLPTSETLFPVYHQTLPLIDDADYNISMGYPLARTPLYGFLSNLIELILSKEDNRYYARDYFRFVLHPYTKNIKLRARAEITRIIFHTLEEEFITDKSKLFFELSDIESDTEYFNKVLQKIADSAIGISADDVSTHLKEIHHNTIRQFESFENIGDLINKCNNVVNYIHNQSTAWLHPLFRQFVESFIENLSAILSSPIRELKFNDARGYFNFIKQYIKTLHTPFPGTPVKGVQVLGFLETRNLTFDKVFFLDANDDIIPKSKSDESLVPDSTRRSLGLPTYKDREEIMRYYFDVLIYGAKEVHIFYIEEDKKEKSRLLERIIWEMEKKGEKPDIRTIQYKINLTNPAPDSIPKDEEILSYLKTFTYSATSIDTYLECPIKFYYRYVLGLEPKEEITADVERTEVGTIVHEALKEYFWNKTETKLQSHHINKDVMNRIVDDLFTTRYGSNISGSVYLLKQRIKNKLSEYLEFYQLPILRSEPVIIQNLEKKVVAELNGFSITGRIDRIEKRGEDTYLMDYKISGSEQYVKINFKKLDLDNRETWSEAIGSLQLPVYMLLYQKINGDDDLSAVHPVYILLGRQGLSTAIEYNPFASSESKNEDIEKLLSIVTQLLHEINDPTVDFTPPKDLKKTCPNCEFQAICGTQWVG